MGVFWFRRIPHEEARRYPEEEERHPGLAPTVRPSSLGIPGLDGAVAESWRVDLPPPF
jgi:hypothetical protein